MISLETDSDDKKQPASCNVSSIDEMMRRHFVGRHSSKTSLCNIDMAWTPETLQFIAEHPKKWMSLHKMVERLETGSRFAFWRMVFENRQVIPRNELLKVWYDCLCDQGCCSYQKVSTQDGVEEYAAKVNDMAAMRNSVITDSLLIDNPIVCYRYCQAEKEGWQMLQYIHGRRRQRLNLGNSLEQALGEDNVPAFAISLDLGTRNVTFSLLVDILEHKAKAIFRYLFMNGMVPTGVIGPDELCCYLASACPDSVSVPFLTLLDDIYPGVVRQTKDVFGRNLLWYAIQNKRTGWFHPDCQLTSFLLAHGCDEQNMNQLGMAWADVRDGLTLELKRKMMVYRYGQNQCNMPNPPMLELKQPMSKLKASEYRNVR